MQQYYCPYCRSPVAVGEKACRRCGQLLSWSPSPVVQSHEVKQEREDTKEAPNRSWLWLLIALLVVVLLAGAGVYYFMRMMEKPPVAAVADNTSTAGTEELIIPDKTAPVISNISVDNIAYNSVAIKWNTNEPSTSQVIWRSDDSKINVTDEKKAMVNQHVVELTDLKNKQRYYFKVRSVDPSYNESISVEDNFDIGLSHGVAAVRAVGDSMKTEEPQPAVFRTVISGKVVNSGEVPIRSRDIEVWIKITVAGQGTSDIKADIDPTPDILYPLYEIGFRAVVPDRTNPDYIVTATITAEQN
ncbi:MAG: fibronectin type III domain-containing protein [Dehalococcoidia bacterium]|nr:fibronectin type III domain-containing protein [Dehalococcoidia bacterium]